MTYATAGVKWSEFGQFENVARKGDGGPVPSRQAAKKTVSQRDIEEDARRSPALPLRPFSCTFETALTTYDTGQHDVVIIRDLALELGKSRSALKSHCRRRDYPFSGVRAPGSRGSLAVAISDAHAQAVRSHYSGARPHAPEGDSDLVALRELAEEFRVTPAGLRKHCRRNGYKLIALVTPASRGQQTFAVTPDDAALIRLYCQFKHWRFRPPGWILPEPKPWK